MKRACVIGAGLGGLALAIRLQAGGIATTVVEAQDAPGGCAQAVTQGGFTFEGGPAAITEPAALRELWELCGANMAADVTLLPVAPACRLHWPDGAHLDISGDEASLRAEIARIAPGDLAGYEDFAAYAAEAYAETSGKWARMPFLDAASMARALPQLARQQAWRSLYARVSGFVKSEKLRQALSYPALNVGGNPLSASALFAAAHPMQKSGVFWAKGGTHQLAEAMAALFTRIGGTLRLGDGAAQIHVVGNRAAEVECISGWRERFDAVASNADLMRTYRDLLSGSPRGPAMAAKLARKRWSPGVFAVHFAAEGTWNHLPHHTVLFGPRFKGWLEDVFEHGVLPRDGIITLSHPTATDPSLAPAGTSLFTAMLPVAHMGRLPIDWAKVGPQLEARLIDEVALRFIPDLRDRLITHGHTTPADFAARQGAYLGAAYSLEPVLSQSAWGRPHNRDDVMANLYLVGAGTHPGAGIPGVVAGARLTAGLMSEDLRA